MADDAHISARAASLRADPAFKPYLDEWFASHGYWPSDAQVVSQAEAAGFSTPERSPNPQGPKLVDLDPGNE